MDVYITHYYIQGTDPWMNIMLLPKAEAFRKAAELAEAFRETASSGRFADFINYYPRRKAADRIVREAFYPPGRQPRTGTSVQFCPGKERLPEKLVWQRSHPAASTGYGPGQPDQLYPRGQLCKI